MPPQQAQQQGSSGGGLDSLVADPQFQSLQPSDQRKALAGVSGDDAFGSLSDDDTGRYIKAHQAILSQNQTNQTLSKTSGISAQPKPFTLPWFKQGAWRAAASTADAMPAIGATAGGAIGAGAGGPVSAVGGAGVGGMGGASLQQIMRRMLGYPDVPQTSGAAAQDIAKQGVTQGAIQAGTEALPFLAGPLKNAATTQYEKALAPTTRANKAITSKIAPELIQRGEYGSLQGLEQTAKENVGNVNPQLDAAYTATPASATRGSGTQIVQDLEALKGKYIVNGQPANPSAVNAISGVQDIVRQYGADINPDSLRKLKSVFDDPVAARGGYAGTDLATAYTLKAQKVAANSIRNIMGQASPDVAALNKEITFWLNVQRVTSATAARQTGQAGGLLRVLSPMGAGIAGTAVGAQFGGHAGLEAGAFTALTTAAVQITRSPLWRTTSAVVKDRLADALARGDVGQVMALASRFGVAAASAPGRVPQGNQTANPAPPTQ